MRALQNFLWLVCDLVREISTPDKMAILQSAR